MRSGPLPPAAAQGAGHEARNSAPADAATSSTRSSAARTLVGLEGPTPSSGVRTRGHRAGRVLAVGDVLRGRYRLTAALGRGSTGTVFEALDEHRLGLPTVNQRIAVKVLHTEITRRPELLFELRREFQHMQSLSHPNIVRVHEFDQDGDLAFFTMELLQGALLSYLLAVRNDSALNRTHALAIIRDVGAALAHAHSRGIVHGDVKPQNVFITDNGEVRVLDFGASSMLLRDARSSGFETPLDSPVATPAYASCQALEGQPADVRDDLYSFACVAYLLLAGQHPFPKHTAVEARTRRMSPRRPAGLTRRQWQALRSGLCSERDRRPSDLQRWLDSIDVRAAAEHLPPLPVLMASPPPRRAQRNLTVMVTTIVLLLAGGLWMTTDHNSLAHRATTLSAGLRHELASAGVFITRIWDEAHRGAGAAVDAVANSDSVVMATSGRMPAASDTTSSVPSADAAATRSQRSTTTTRSPDPRSSSASAPNSSAAPGAPAAAIPPPAPAASGAPTRIELAEDMIEASSVESLARVVVRRSGSLRGDVQFVWWTESGSAKAGDDFASFGARAGQMEDLKDSVELLIPIVSDLTRRQPKSFYVVIGQAGPGALLGARTRSVVIIQPANQLPP
jgi:serine/threonine protein kinase